MNKLFTLVLGLTIGATSFSQVFESDLSNWSAGVPDDFMGSKTSLDPANVTEDMTDVEYGTSKAILVNEDSGHKRFTTQTTTVVGGEAYEIKIWVSGTGGSELRTAFYDETNDSYGTYNDYFNLATETGGDITLLSQTIVVPASCTEGQFILSIRNTDAAGIIIDSVAMESTAPPVATEVSIYDIQFATEAPFISAYEGELIQTSGIVTGVFNFGANEGRFFIQDGEGAWNGVYVYDNSTTVNLGDSVVVVAEVTEFFELTELTGVSSITVVSSDNDMPNAVEVSTADAANEEYEGVLVTVVDSKCTNDDAGFGQFELNDDSGARLVDDEMFAYAATTGSYYTVTGVTFLSFGDVKIYPRSIDDITVTGFASTSNYEINTSIYPNPANEMVTISATTGSTVAIYAVTGELVYSGNTGTIDVSAFNTGIYTVTITTENTVTTKQLVIK